MKTYTLNKSMLYKLIIVCFLFLCLTGCDYCSIVVDPNVLDFGEDKDTLDFTLTVPEICGLFEINEDAISWVDNVWSDYGTGIFFVSVSRDGLDPGEYSGVLEIELLDTGAVTTVTLKMTVPGDDDNTTTTTELPTTTTTIPISTSTTTEPATTSTTTTSIFVGDPPTIHSISFPGEIIADGVRNSGTVSFSDPDGDIVRAYFDLVSGYGFSASDFDPMESLKEGDGYDGTFGFSIWCIGSTRYMKLEITLKDQAGNMSNSETFGFTCTEEE